MVLTTFQIKIPENVIKDLTVFISENYEKKLPNSLLVAQAFILRYPNYGKALGLPVINSVIEYGIKYDLFFKNNENFSIHTKKCKSK